jgi:hypothetical protein|tara:strand:- start:18775 stop:18999 length:225 start_codon:yes stop_codon:yes gene_type:complete
MKEEETYCHYSDLPSPLAYIKDDYIDYDGMGNQGRFPNKKDKIKSSTMKRFISKILLWWSYKKPKNNKKSIWDL